MALQVCKTNILRLLPALTSAMGHYAVRSAPYSNRPWSMDGKDADEGVAREHGSYSNQKSLNSVERSRRIKKRQEEWKKVLSSGKSKEDTQAVATSLRQVSLSQPPLRDRRHLLVDDRRASSGDIKENRHVTKTAETLSLRDLQDRRRRGELVQAAKLAVNVQVAETNNLRELREQRRLQRQRELDTKKRAETSHRLSKLEREMSSPAPKTAEPEVLPPPAPAARKRRQKPKMSRAQKSIETDWLDSLLIKIFSASCCAGREVLLDPVQ